jgi:hypothetical protein
MSSSPIRFSTNQSSKLHFDMIHKQDLGQEEEKIYKTFSPKHGKVIVLFSEDDTPLAVFNVVYDDKKLYEQNAFTFLTELPSSTKGNNVFQAISTVDNVCVNFLITNLTNGHINFNIIKNEMILNAVNSLREFETHCVKSDHSHGDQKMTISSSSNGGITLEKELQQSASEKVGSYINLSVIPCMDHSMKEKFDNAAWKPVDFFVIEEKKPYKCHSRGASRNGSFERTIYMDELEIAVQRGEQLAQPQGRVGELIHQNALIEDMDEDYLDIRDRRWNAQPYSFGTSPFPNRNESPMFRSSGTREPSQKQFNDDNSMRPLSLSFGKKPSPQMNEAIMQSTVAKIQHSAEVHVERTQNSEILFDYSVKSAQCSIGMSIMKNVNIVQQTKEDLVQQIQISINLHMNKIVEEMTVYASETCCICLTDAPNTVFLRCGHKNTCSECFKHLNSRLCPSCRRHIMASIETPPNA